MTYNNYLATWLIFIKCCFLAYTPILCSWARHSTLKVPLSIQVYKWVLANLLLGGNLAMDGKILSSHCY